MNHHVDLKAPAFLYLEGIYKGKVNDDKTEDFDFDSGSFEEFVSRYVCAHLFDTQRTNYYRSYSCNNFLTMI